MLLIDPYVGWIQFPFLHTFNQGSWPKALNWHCWGVTPGPTTKAGLDPTTFGHPTTPYSQRTHLNQLTDQPASSQDTLYKPQKQTHSIFFLDH